MNERNKKIITILSVFTIIFTLMGGTLAYWNWSSTTRTGVSFTLDKDFSCSADGGGNITPSNISLEPSTCDNLNTTIKRTVKVTPNIKRSGLNISLDMWLTINSIGTPLSESENLKYVVTTNANSCTQDIVSTGNFKGLTTGGRVNLLDDKIYSSTTTDTYYLYIWLDKEESNPNTMNQSFNFSLGGECTDDDRKTLSSEIISLSNVENSGVTNESVAYDEPGEKTLIPANGNSWSDMILDSGITVISEETGEYVGSFECGYNEWGDLEETKSNAKFKPLKTGYYNLSIQISYNGTYQILINDEYFCGYDNPELGYSYPCTGEEEPFYATPEDEIKIVIYGMDCWNYTTGEAIFKFYYAEAEEKPLPNTYRYRGKEANNYILFNNEIWRIIGLEEGTTIGLDKGKYYPKIIKDEVINSISYDYDGFYSMPWGETAIYTILNEGYYNQQSINGFNFSTTGLDATSRNLIVKPNWLGVNLNWNSTTEQMYVSEVLYKTNAENTDRIYITDGYIGLMSPSDYGFAALPGTCENINLTSYSNCINNNWLYSDVEEWLIGGEDEIYIDECPWCAPGIKESGNVGYLDAHTAIGYRPVVYLKPNVKITGGTGELGNEYQIELPS